MGKKDSKKVKGLDKEPKKGNKVVHQAADEVSADANMVKAKKALKGGKGTLVAEPVAEADESKSETLDDLATRMGIDPYAGISDLEREIMDEDSNLGTALTEANEALAQKAAPLMTTYPHGRFELKIPETNSDETFSQKLNAFALREHAIDLSLKPRPTEVQQHVLHNARMSRFKHGDPIMLAAVEATDPSVQLPANITMEMAVGGSVSGPGPASGDIGGVPADIAAMKQPGTNRPLTQGQVLTEMLVRAQHKANASGEAVGVVVPRKYATKNYGLNLMKTFNETDTEASHGVRLNIVNHSDEFVPDANAKGGGGFQVTLTVEPDPNIPAVPKGMEHVKQGVKIPVSIGGDIPMGIQERESAKIEPQDVADWTEQVNQDGRDIAAAIQHESGVKAGKKDKGKPAKLGKGKANVVDLNSIKRKRG